MASTASDRNSNSAAATITAPSALGVARHWVVHKNKKPYGSTGGSTGWNLAEFWFTFDEAKKKLSSNSEYDGIGFIIARESGRKDNQIIGGDLDNCRDPITGEGSAWALDILKKLNTSSAPSFTGCGYRIFCYGKLPDGLNEIKGHGIDDLSDETKERIMVAKPDVRAKLEKYGPSEVWNGFELYEDGPKHLTVTGEWLPEYPTELQHRNVEILEIISPFLEATPVPAPAAVSMPGKAPRTNIPGSRFPHLSVLDVIDTIGFERSGDELVGPNPATGSTTGTNLKVNLGKEQWCNFHDDIKKGGDAWVFLACECGAVPWEKAGAGVLADPIVIAKTMMHAANRGLIPETPDIVAAFRRSMVEKKPEGLTPEETLERIKANSRALKEPAILAALAVLKANDPIEYDLLIDSIKKAHKGLKVDTIHALVDKHVLDSEKAKEKPQDTPKDITAAAQSIIDAGGAYEYIYKIWQKRVKGNAYLGKALLVSRGVQSCLNTKGVHVYAHGKHGHGKSEGMEKMIELVPPEYRMDEDVSPLAIHYASKNGMLLPGTTLLIDEMVWNDSLGGIIKRVITRFQKGAGHLPVIDGESVLVRTQPRLAIWTNSADLQADEQLRDRFLDEPIDEGKNYVNEIIEFQKLRDTLPDTNEDADRETAICQAILRDLASKTFTVKIPYATRIKIEVSEGTRGYNIFSDLVKGLAVMRYAQRKTNTQGQLLATETDFKDAKDIYEGSKGHSEESYTTAETKVLQAIIDHGYKALYKDIKNLTGLSEGRIKDIVNGRGKDEQKRHGLRYKCSQLDVNTVDISVVIAGTYSDRVTTHPVELSLPNSFSVDAGVRKNLVSLDTDVERRNPDVDRDVIDIDNSRDSDVVDVVNEEREEEDTSKLQTSSVDGSISPSKQKTQKTTSTTSPSPPMAESTTTTLATPGVNYGAVDTSEKIRAATIAEYNMSRWIDSRKIARALELPIEEVEAWLQVNYVAYQWIKAAAISEYGMAGWVDPRKISSTLKLPLQEVEAWLQTNYAAFEREGGGVGYRQRRSGEAPA